MCLTDIMKRTNMKYTPSINIAQTTFNPAGYIVTQNALGVVGKIVDSFNAGVIHSTLLAHMELVNLISF